MADGKTHQKVNYGFMVGTAITIILLLFFGISFELNIIIALSLGILFGFLFDPDLDLEGISMAEYRLGKFSSIFLTWVASHNKEYVKKVINFFTLLWKVFWYPYALFIPHRSPFSHLPILGDIIRILYFMFVGSFLILFFIMVWNTYTFDYITKNLKDLFFIIFSNENLELKIAFVFGSSIMTFSHLMMDSFKIRW